MKCYGIFTNKTLLFDERRRTRVEYIQNNPIVILIALAVIGAIFGVGRWTGNVNSDRDSFKKFISEVKGKLDKIYDHLIGVKATASGSPLYLTEYGEKISAQVLAKDIARRLSEVVVDEIREMQSFEIQAFCEKYMKTRFRPTNDEDLRIKKCQYEMGASRDVIIHEVIMIELRDKLLQLTSQN